MKVINEFFKELFSIHWCGVCGERFWLARNIRKHTTKVDTKKGTYV